jgi:hypothetical protein
MCTPFGGPWESYLRTKQITHTQYLVMTPGWVCVCVCGGGGSCYMWEENTDEEMVMKRKRKKALSCPRPKAALERSHTLLLYL